MRSAMARILGEPLVQFLAIGAVIVAVAMLVDRPPPPAGNERIVVDGARIAELENLAARTWQRQPTEADLARLVEAYVREEILSREARKLGLDQDDSIIRQRLAQKMTFLMEPPPGASEASDEALEAFLAQNIARYRDEPRIAFQQVYLSPQIHKGALDDDAAAILAALRQGADPAALADPTQLPATVDETAIGNVRRVFGPDFAKALMALPEGTWSGPVPSPFGSHLVRIASHREPPEPTLASVRAAVERDYRLERQKAHVEERYRTLRARYDVVIDTGAADDAAEAPATPDAGG